MSGRRWVVPLILTATSYTGFAVSLYLTFVHYRGYVSHCYVVEGCEQVQTSRFAVIFGVPVALLGLIFFTAMFYLGIGVLTRSSVKLVRAYKVLAYLGALAAVPLFLVQAIALRAYCTYCVLTEIILLVMWGVSFLLKAPAQASETAKVGAAPRGKGKAA